MVEHPLATREGSSEPDCRTRSGASSACVTTDRAAAPHEVANPIPLLAAPVALAVGLAVAAGVLLSVEFDDGTTTIAAAAAAAGIGACAAWDQTCHRLPALLVTTTAVAPLLFLAAGTFLHERPGGSLARAIAAVAAVWLGFFLVRAASARGLGYGDVRLAAAAAVVPGWLSWAAVAVLVFAAFVAAAALLVIAPDSRTVDNRQPFAPALALGWITALALVRL